MVPWLHIFMLFNPPFSGHKRDGFNLSVLQFYICLTMNVLNIYQN